MYIEIDECSGFCFGVTTAIRRAEETLQQGDTLYCLGDIVHNTMEVRRLKSQGLITIDHEEFARLDGVKVLLRAHGEPPQTYAIAKANNIEIIDTTCPVVLALQQRIRRQAVLHPEAQIVIFGKKGHAEVLGLVGQSEHGAIVVDSRDDLSKVDFTKDIYLYSQTTRLLSDYARVVSYCRDHIAPGVTFVSYDTICRQVANRIEGIQAFASRHDLILFVCGEKSSNGRALYTQCLAVNSNTHLIERAAEIDRTWLRGISSVGICGGTSTPKWLMEDCQQAITDYLN